MGVVGELAVNTRCVKAEVVKVHLASAVAGVELPRRFAHPIHVADDAWHGALPGGLISRYPPLLIQISREAGWKYGYDAE